MPVPQPAINADHKARDWTNRKGLRARKIVLHATAGTDSLRWLSGNPEGTSIHYLVRKDGLCYKMLDESKGANHVGYSRMVIDGVVYSRFSPYGCNQVTLGIELENLNNGKDPYPEAQLRSAAWIVECWMRDYNLQRSDVICHRDIDEHSPKKTDPKGLTVLDVFRFIDEAPAPITELLPTSSILGQAHGTPELAASYLTRHGTDPSYTSDDHIYIAKAYWGQSALVGVDPLMVFAQMIHETGCLTSWWSRRPRRNPAGIGVTGEMSRSKTSPGENWQFDDKSKLWKKGYAFKNWTDSVNAHLGHLIGYAVIPSERTEAQRQMVMCDPRAKAMPIAYRGIAKTWDGLNGRWAVPGLTYSTQIAEIANRILQG